MGNMRRLGLNVGLCVLLGSVLVLAACGTYDTTPKVAGGDPTRGRVALQGYGCEACHAIPGVGNTNAMVGPPLEHFANRRFIAGELSNEPDNLIKWILNPQSVEPGIDMPNLDVSEAAARDMAAYLYTLK